MLVERRNKLEEETRNIRIKKILDGMFFIAPESQKEWLQEKMKPLWNEAYQMGKESGDSRTWVEKNWVHK